MPTEDLLRSCTLSPVVAGEFVAFVSRNRGSSHPRVCASARMLRVATNVRMMFSSSSQRFFGDFEVGAEHLDSQSGVRTPVESMYAVLIGHGRQMFGDVPEKRSFSFTHCNSSNVMCSGYEGENKGAERPWPFGVPPAFHLCAIGFLSA